MMWFLMLGIFLLMAASAGVLSLSVAQLFDKKRSVWLGSNEEKNILRLFAQNLALVATSPSPNHARLQSFFFQNLRLRSWRANLLWSALSSFSLWLPFLVALSLYRVSGIFVMALGGLVFAISSFVKRFQPAALLILSWGAFLFLIETGTRTAAGLVSGEGMELISFLSDGRPSAVLMLFGLSLIVATVFQFQFLFFSVAVLLLSAGWISLTGAVLLWFGERVGLAIGAWIRGRKARTGPRRLLFLSLCSSLVGGVVGLLLVGFARDGMVAVPAFGEAGPFESLQAFVFLSIIAEIPLFAVASVLGHFEAKAVPDDLFEKSDLKPDLSVSAFSGGILRPAWMGLEFRLQKLRSVRGELNNEDWQKIPPGIRTASEGETKDLEAMAAEIRTHLLSRSSGFPDSLR